MDLSPEQLAPIESQFNAHPAIQAYFRMGRNSPMDWLRAVGQASRDLQIQVPHDYQPEQRNGQVKLEKRGFLQRNPWVLPAVAVGGPLAAGAALGAFGGAGAAGAVGGAGAADVGMTTGPTLAQAGLGAAGAGGGIGKIIEMLAKVGGPAAITAMTRNRGGAGGPFDVGGSGGQMGNQLSEIMDLAKRRMERTEPVHEAAMNQIMRMQPGTAGYGRVEEASRNAMQPTPQQGMSPQVMEAYQRLMRGRR